MNKHLPSKKVWFRAIVFADSFFRELYASQIEILKIPFRPRFKRSIMLAGVATWGFAIYIAFHVNQVFERIKIYFIK